MKHAATTKTTDGQTVTGRGNTLPEAIRDAAKKRAEHERKIQITQNGGTVYVGRN